MPITNKAESFQSGIDGAGPAEWFAGSDLDGTIGQAVTAPIGSRRHYGNKTYKRFKNAHSTLGSRTDDWAVGLHCLTQTVKVSEFTDGGSTAGTFALTEKIPAGAWVLRTVLVNLTGFTGDTSATLIVGDGTDTDRYNTGTPSVFTTAVAVDMGAPSGTQIHTAEKTVTLTITSGADFTSVSAGQLTIRIYYLN